TFGRVRSLGNGTFVVLGRHRFARPGSFPIIVFVGDRAGDVAAVQSTAVVTRRSRSRVQTGALPGGPLALRPAFVAATGLARDTPAKPRSRAPVWERQARVRQCVSTRPQSPDATSADGNLRRPA